VAEALRQRFLRIAGLHDRVVSVEAGVSSCWLSSGGKDTVKLLDVLKRTVPPVPWEEGEKIPWHDPAFSERMLDEHLSPAHDAASRRAQKIEAQVEWIHSTLLSGRPTKILDLGCGPGLYTSRLAGMGHECVGIDYSPASIAYARRCAEEEDLTCTYVKQDIRNADFGMGYGLVMLIFGEFNVFRPCDAQAIVSKTYAALNAGGSFVLEPHTPATVEEAGKAPSSWRTAQKGLFSDRPHLCLEESFWDSESRAATTRYWIVDGATGDVTRYASTMQAYTDQQYRSLLAEAGFTDIRFFPSLTGVEDESQAGLMAIVSRKA